MPAHPGAQQFVRIAAGRHDIFQVIERQALSLRAIRAILAFAVVALQRRIDLRKLRACLRDFAAKEYPRRA